MQHQIAVTDFVMRACSKACERHEAGLDLHQAGRAFAAAGTHGFVLVLALLALVACGVWAIRARS